MAMEVQSPLVDQTNTVKTGGGSYPPVPTQGTTSAGNTLSKIDVVVPVESIRAISARTLGWNPDVDLLKEDVGNVSVWVKLHGVPVMEFSEDGLSVIAKKRVGFKPYKEYRPIPKKPIAGSSGNKKKGVEPTNEVSNSNPFEVLNSVDNDVELGTNEGTTNLVNNRANSSGSSFMNVENSSIGPTPIIDKIRNFKDLLISGQAILMDEAVNPLKKVECQGD
ncbi:hypothetical protein Tco_0719572 [Tanacetum coccineum]